MSDNKRTNRGINGRGYYIALVLCAAAIGITGYLYYQNANEEEPVLQETQLEDIIVGTPETEEIVPALATEPKVEAAVPEVAPAEPAVKKPMQTGAPVSGEAITDYSMEALSYNQTTRDWRVHNGVDYAAEEGTQVMAAADGQVYTVYEDDTMGHTVVIRHEGGYATCYSSLSPEIPVKPGDQVTMGQVIGYAGATALVETTLGSHVHFSVTYRDEPMDPAEFLQLG